MNTVVVPGFATESSRWYAADGSPAYEVIGANGKLRPATLRDARKLGLVPSVTSILRLEASPGLERWKIQQAMLACLTLPRNAGETDDAFMARALQDSQEQGRKASERGTYLHGLLERAMAGPLVGVPERDMAIVEPVLTWLRVNFNGYTWSPERSFASSSGYGGKTDLVGECANQSVVLDFKTKSGIKPDKDLAYPEHVTQLAAYAYGMGLANARCINLFIDVDVPGLIVPKEWTAEERDTGWQAFECLLKLWKLRKGIA
jgi:hypothetical protein